jgi:hypothetical protein
MAEWSAQLWPSIREGRKPEPASIHLFVASMWSSEQLRQHIKRPAATLDRPATLPGVDRSLYSLTVRSTSRGIAALSIRSASSHHSNGWLPLRHAILALAQPAAYTVNAGCALIKPKTMAYLPTLYIQRRLNKLYMLVLWLSFHNIAWYPIVYCMVCGRRVSIQYFSNKCSVICFFQGFFHFTWTEHICFCSPDINNIFK